MSFLRKYWFTLSLIAAAVATLADPTELLAAGGRWLGAHGGPQLCVASMFLLSGLTLDADRARSGIGDLRCLATSLLVIFLAAPLLALLLTTLPLDAGLEIGLLLTAIMPTTLSSGVVMAGLAGGNPATALMVTLVASWLAILTIPPSLDLLLGSGLHAGTPEIDKAALALRLGLLVLAPLASGLALRHQLSRRGVCIPRRLGQIGQIFVLTIVWIATSRSHATLLQAPASAAQGVVLAATFHGLLLLAAVAAAHLAGLGPGRREVVWFMGAQKTLPIAVLLQTALFPTYGSALVFCVVHHVVHLAADGYLVGRMAAPGTAPSPPPHPPRRAPSA